MTRKEAQIILPALQAYAEGKQIQTYSELLESWQDIDYPSFNPGCRYRVKPDDEKPKNRVTQQDVAENMKDVLVETRIEFGKPCTYVTVRMKNGFTLRESATCVDPVNYDENIGKSICLEKIEDKIWFLLGYQLQEEISKRKR